MFWLGTISPEQALDLKGRAGGVIKTVMPDGPFRTEPLRSALELMTQGLTPAAAGTDGRFKVLSGVSPRRYRRSDFYFLSNTSEAPKDDLRS